MSENKIVVDKFKTVDKIVKLTEPKRKILFVYDFLDMGITLDEMDANKKRQTISSSEYLFHPHHLSRYVRESRSLA